MAKSTIERELKFDVEPGFRVPDVRALLPTGGRIEQTTEHLRSDYFDTAAHALLGARMTLRRRSGSTDAGWQLKVPHAPFREEITLPPDADGVPTELQELLLGVSRAEPLIQIASVVTERSVSRLVTADGQVLAEIDDDLVRASASGDAATISSWREVEVELGTDDEDLLHALGERLQRAGARPSSSSSKLARALPASESTTPRPSESAAAVIADYITEQRRVIVAGDLALRRDDDAAVHKTRVAARRLRSTLRVFAPLFQSDKATHLDEELRWFADLLGDVRDRQVLRARLAEMVDRIDDTLVLGSVRARIDNDLRGERAEYWQRVRDALCGSRYLAMLDEVDRWAESPPWTDHAQRPAKTLRRRVYSAQRKVARRLDDADAKGDVALLHSARKAAKRARYAAEATPTVLGRKTAGKAAKRFEKLQDVLGEHHDSLVSAQVLRRLGAWAGTVPGENGFTFGLLYEREQANADAARAAALRRARKLPR